MAEEVANAVNDSAVQDTATAASAPVEETKLEVVREGAELNPNDYREANDEDTSSDEADDTDEPVAVEETEAPQGEKDLAPKSENRFQKLANERNQFKEENAQLKAQLAAREAQVAQEQELLNEINPETGDYYSPVEAERIARNQYLESQKESLAQERGQLEVQQNVQQLASEANQVTSEIPLFREVNPDGSPNPEFNAEVAATYNDLLGDNLLYRYQDGQVYTANVLAQNGVDLTTQATLVGSYQSPYKLAKLAANAYNASAVANQIKGQKATEKMLAASDSPTSTKPAKASSEDEASMSPKEYAKAHGLKQVW